MIVVATLLGANASAQTALDRLPRDAAGDVVRRSIEYAGGWGAWQSIKTLEFQKTTTRFDAKGALELKRVQHHRYVLQPRLHARIEWKEDGTSIVLVNDGNRARKLVNGEEQKGEDATNEARNATFGSHYVVGMPFKLADPGARLAYLGRERLAGGIEALKVRVTYDRGTGDAGGLHTWTYYFDAGTGRLCANHLNYGPGQYDFTEYLDEVEVGAFKLAARRLGYEADERGPKGPRRSEIVYEDIRANVTLAADLFVAPD